MRHALEEPFKGFQQFLFISLFKFISKSKKAVTNIMENSANDAKPQLLMSCLSPMDAAPSEAIVSASTVGLWLELLVEHPLVLCLSALNLVILCRTKVIHQNLRLLLLCQSASIALFECWTIWAPVEKLLNRNIFYAGSVASQHFALFVSLFRNSLGHILLLERLLATLFFRKYEKHGGFWFSAGWLTILLTFCIFNIVTKVDESLCFSLVNVVSTVVMLMLSFLEFLFIAAIGFYNGKKYLKFVPNHCNYSIGEKFQLSENIRTARQLCPVFLCHVLNNFIIVITGALIHFGWVQGHQILLAIQASVMLTSIIDLLIEVVVITHHPALKKKFYRILKKICLICPNTRIDNAETTGSVQQPTNINGDSLIHSSTAENHFQMLAQAWK